MRKHFDDEQPEQQSAQFYPNTAAPRAYYVPTFSAPPPPPPPPPPPLRGNSDKMNAVNGLFALQQQQQQRKRRAPTATRTPLLLLCAGGAIAAGLVLVLFFAFWSLSTTPPPSPPTSTTTTQEQQQKSSSSSSPPLNHATNNDNNGHAANDASGDEHAFARRLLERLRVEGNAIAKGSNDFGAGNSNDDQFECQKRYFRKALDAQQHHDSFVCVCNAQHCDYPQPWTPAELQSEHALVYLSSKAEHRLKKSRVAFEKSKESEPSPAHNRTADGTVVDQVLPVSRTRRDEGSANDVTVNGSLPVEVKGVKNVELVVNVSNQFQKVFGFGGAFTDAAGINLRALSETTQARLLQTYFSPKKGIGYTIGRVPIASTDFSTREYSYLDEEGDFEQRSWALAAEDSRYKIPYIMAAMNLSEGRLELFSSPWSAPGWLKTNGRMKDGAPIKGDYLGPYYKTYAEYIRRFFDAYANKGVRFWGMTVQNEPRKGDWLWQTMDLPPKMQRDFVYYLLSPELKKSEAAKNVKIMVFDDNRGEAFEAARDHFYADAEKAKAIDGIALHWYDHGDFHNLTMVNSIRPDKFLLASEACTGWNGWEHQPLPGDWGRGREYGTDIVKNLRHWVTGWTDWNLCLDMIGGPNWANNFVDAPILVNATADEFYKSPMFYFLAHFSSFIPRDSIRIDSQQINNNNNNEIGAGQTNQSTGVEHVAFVTPSGERVLVLINHDSNQGAHVRVSERSSTTNGGQQQASLTFEMPPDSILTSLWREPSPTR